MEKFKIPFLMLTLAKVQFPDNGSIWYIVRKRYGGEVLKAIPKFEKVD